MLRVKAAPARQRGKPVKPKYADTCTHCAAAVAPMAAEGCENQSIANRSKLGQSKAALRVMWAFVSALSE